MGPAFPDIPEFELKKMQQSLAFALGLLRKLEVGRVYLHAGFALYVRLGFLPKSGIGDIDLRLVDLPRDSMHDLAEIIEAEPDVLSAEVQAPAIIDGTIVPTLYLRIVLKNGQQIDLVSDMSYVCDGTRIDFPDDWIELTDEMSIPGVEYPVAVASLEMLLIYYLLMNRTHQPHKQDDDKVAVIVDHIGFDFDRYQDLLRDLGNDTVESEEIKRKILLMEALVRVLQRRQLREDVDHRNAFFSSHEFTCVHLLINRDVIDPVLVNEEIMRMLPMLNITLVLVIINTMYPSFKNQLISELKKLMDKAQGNFPNFAV